MKKFIFIVIVFVGAVGVAHAQIDSSPETTANVDTLSTTPTPSSAAQQTSAPSGFVALAPIPGLTSGTGGVIDSNTLANFFNNLYKYLIGLAAILAVIEIIRGGIEISTQDSVSKQGVGRHRITQAILGLILVLAPVLVFSIINPSILNLSLNLPKLDTAAIIPFGGAAGGTGGGTGGATTPTTPVVTPAKGCTTSFNGSVETAVCANDGSAQNYKCRNGNNGKVTVGGGTGFTGGGVISISCP